MQHSPCRCDCAAGRFRAVSAAIQSLQASVVSKMREDISNLKIQLSELLEEAQRLDDGSSDVNAVSPADVDLGALDKAKRLLDGVSPASAEL